MNVEDYIRINFTQTLNEGFKGGFQSLFIILIISVVILENVTPFFCVHAGYGYIGLCSGPQSTAAIRSMGRRLTGRRGAPLSLSLLPILTPREHCPRVRVAPTLHLVTCSLLSNTTYHRAQCISYHPRCTYHANHTIHPFHRHQGTGSSHCTGKHKAFHLHAIGRIGCAPAQPQAGRRARRQGAACRFRVVPACASKKAICNYL